MPPPLPATTTPQAPPPPPPPPPPPRRMGNVSLPYYSGITEPLTRLFNSKGLSTTIKARGSLRENLVKPKDKLGKEEKVGVIYHIPCAGINSTPCPGTYVGETERTANARFNEHTSTASNALGKYKSAMLQHAREEGHHFRRQDVTVMDHEQDWVRRGIKEAIYIRALSPSINIDSGRHTLSHHFDKVIKDKIVKPPAPAVHNAQTEEAINTAPRRQGRPRQAPASQETLPKQQQQPQQSQQQQQQQVLRRSVRLRLQSATLPPIGEFRGPPAAP